jgi:molybdopterin-guanine dinucleotide biosynthesis protein B
LGVGYLKHSHHRIEVDRPGKDSYEIREAGASQVLLATGERWIMQSVQHQHGLGPDQDQNQDQAQDQNQNQDPCPDQFSGPDQGPDPDLAAMLALFDPRLVDLILVEGFKFSAYPKLEVHRAALAKPYLYPGDPAIRALISDGPPPAGDHPPLLPLGEPAAVVDYLLSLLSLPSAPAATFASSAPPEPSPTSPSPPQS